MQQIRNLQITTKVKKNVSSTSIRPCLDKQLYLHLIAQTLNMINSYVKVICIAKYKIT